MTTASQVHGNFPRFRTLALVYGAGTLLLHAATGAAQEYVPPYYDAARDVMVTPRLPPPQTTVVPIEQDVRSTTRTPDYTAVTRPVELPPTTAGAAPASSSPRVPSGDRVLIRESQGNDAYYDRERDVIVATPDAQAVIVVDPSAPLRAEFVIRRGRLVQGPGVVSVDLGRQITLVVDTDGADELRVEGYGIAAPLAAGQPMMLTFLAQRPGRFPLHLYSGEQIGMIDVLAAGPAAASAP